MNDRLTGLFLIPVAVLGLVLAWPLGSSSTVGLGPGFVPKVFAVILLGLGAAIAANGIVFEGEAVEAWYPRQLLLVPASIVFFAVTIERLGLVVALVGLVLLCCAAHSGTRLHEAILLAVGSVVFSVLVLVKALGLPIMLRPPDVWGG